MAAVPGPDTAVPSAAVTAPGPARKGLIDLHTHAIAPSLPDLAAVAPWAHWPSVEQSSETDARILVGGRRVMAERDRDRRDHLQRHAFGVHVGQPPAGGPAAAVDVPVRPAAYQDARVRLAALLHGWPVRPRRYGREIRQRRCDGMGVQVDEPHNQRCLGTTGP